MSIFSIQDIIQNILLNLQPSDIIKFTLTNKRINEYSKFLIYKIKKVNMISIWWIKYRIYRCHECNYKAYIVISYKDEKYYSCKSCCAPKFEYLDDEQHNGNLWYDILF